MIKNERQYKITRSQIERLSQLLLQVKSQDLASGESHPLLKKAQEDALGSQITVLQDEIHEYEAWQRGEFQFAQLISIAELPRMLIGARMASGLSQRELADRMGLQEQQIQRYEASEYESASLTRIRSVVAALGVRVDNALLQADEAFTFKTLLRQVSKTGLQEEFIRRRLLPRKGLPSSLSATDQRGSVAAHAAAETIARIFQWSLKQLKGEDTLELKPAFGQVHCKVAPNAQPDRVKAYTMYVCYLSQLVIKASSHIPAMPIPTDPHLLRADIESGSGCMSLRSIVNYIWELGVAVLPLDDPSAFHGACIRENGRNAIVLQQGVSSESRWAFDLLHALWHAGQEPEQSERSVLEWDEMSAEHHESEEEMTANHFAAAVLLQGRDRELAEKCLELAGSDLRQLKQATISVADNENVPVAALANCLAFRLASEQGKNWWDTAHSLQSNGNPYGVVRNLFFERADCRQLAVPDRELLSQALVPWEREAYG